MLRIDPHAHTAISDGTDTPKELMYAAARAGLNVVGLTDHDTIDGWDEAAQHVSASGVALLRGAEISASADGITVHILGFLFNPTDPGIMRICERTRHDRQTRAQRIVERIAADYPITFADVQRQAHGSAVIGRPHIADALVEAGIFPDRSAAFVHVLHPRGPYYVHHWAPDPVEVVQKIRAAGGVPVLAHPRAAARQRLLGEDVIAHMAEAGLFAMERDHRDHDEQGKKDVERLARDLRICVTGSSDYHGSGKPNHLGENLTSEHVFRQIEEQGFLEVLYPHTSHEV
ncbi:PHP domain-containing protein [Schaalia sp. lx-100]|uniref:PHP domain-containing protein n=1 Tax=Schaalia sp. lx-100 TaxID=2899081 RepID=UPI001E3FDD57|nr:PHP domain-containing protein [Schaalia sp. lx-100]MCD4557272.1 PHP domain-containing protein [Schaalia sp. lx-100]